MRYYLTLLLIVFTTVGFAQKQKLPKYRNLQLFINEQSVQANVLMVNKKVIPKNNREYYWYYNNEIKKNQGGYKGNLLSGPYRVMDINGNMIEKGNFILGTKNGEWKKWNTEGELLSIYTWKKGVRSGSYQLYEKGKLKEKGKFKNDLKNGQVTVFKSDTIFSKIKYKNGEIVPEKENKIKRKKKTEVEENSQSNTKNEWWKFWKKKEGEETTEKPKTRKNNKEKKVKENKKQKEKKTKEKKTKND